ncbi:TetR/AcrR family transcriptional regulator [Cohnella sp. GCM10027633]|uniref:TetR/AcrR family transcriptional regulator n=1 Tax=unclassified Cohnella TaxID=2636738 RepID=UPI00362D743E
MDHTNRTNNGHDGREDEDWAGLSNGAKLSWGIVKPSRRGPKGELSIAKIVEAAVEIADREGLAGLSMNRVASALGFTTMSLYRYIASKEDLLVLMQEAVSGADIPPEREDADWRAEMKGYVHACIQVFVKHPWYGDIPIAGIPTTPNALRFVDWALRTMRHFPVNDYEKMSFLLLLSSYARSYGIIHRDAMRMIQAGGTMEGFNGMMAGPALRKLVKPDLYPELHPVVASGIFTGEQEQHNPVANDLEFGLERILDGIAAYLERKGMSAT